MFILRVVIDMKIRFIIYYAYIYSVAQFIQFFFFGLASEVEKICIIQKPFLIVMTFSPWWASW